jgi:hypothetical protein
VSDVRQAIKDMKLSPDDTYRDRDWLYKHYVEEQLSSVKMAEMVGCARSTIQHWLNKHDIQMRSKSEAMTIRYSGEHSPTPTTWPDDCIPPAFEPPLTRHRGGKCAVCEHIAYCDRIKNEESVMPYPCQAIRLSDIIGLWMEEPARLIELFERYT